MTAYSKTPWENNNFPEISADNLGRIETASEHALGVDTIAAIRALGTPDTAYRCWVRGSSSVNDGGGGAFDWDSTSSASDDGVTIILPTGHTGNGRWLKNSVGSKIIGKREVFVPISQMHVFTSNPAVTTAKYGDDTSSESSFDGFSFSGTTYQYVAFSIIMPESLDISEDITFKVAWIPTTATGGNVLWKVQPFAYVDGSDTNAGYSGSATVITDAAGTTADLMRISGFSGALDFGTESTVAKGGIMSFNFTRMGSSVSDTYADAALLVGVVIGYYDDAGDES